MGTGDPAKPYLTARQEKWFASVRASLERDTGRSLADWIAIARTCPHEKPRARTDWLREQHGLGINRASYVLMEAFPSADSWSDPEPLRARLWADPQQAEILAAVELALAPLDDVVTGQRKGFTAFSRKVQFAAARPVKGAGALLGLALEPDAAAGLEPRGNESWSERCKAKVRLGAPEAVDDRVADLLRQAWARS